MASTASRTEGKDVPDDLFKSVKYYMIGTIDTKVGMLGGDLSPSTHCFMRKNCELVQDLLDAGGAKRDTYLSEMVSHAIAADINEDEVAEAVDLFEVPVVTPQWVLMSIRCGVLLPTNAFNLEIQQLFLKVVACKSKLLEDTENVWSLLTYYGAKCQQKLDCNVTHLICTRPEGVKYEAAVRRDVKVVTPDWVFDSIAEKTIQDEAIYHPRLLIIIPKSPTPSSPSPVPSLKDEPEEETVDDPEPLPVEEVVPGAPLVVEKKVEPATPVSALPRSSLDDILDIVAASPHAVDEYWQANWEPKGVTKKVEKQTKPVANGNRGPWGSKKKDPSQEPLPEFHGHDPSEKVPEDACLLGCVFYISEYQKYDELDAWKEVIALNGGTIDTDYSNRVTHLLCESQRTDIFAMALKDGKRVVTAHWLNDVLLRREMRPPWTAIHFPSLYGTNKPCSNQIICITNYEGVERTKVKYMINLIGAKYTTYMTHSNSALVCKRPGGMKYEKAKEWRIPTVNAQWLNDLVLGHLDALRIPINMKYTRLGQDSDFDVDLRKVLRLMEGWKTSLKIPASAWEAYKPRPLQPLNGVTTNKRKADEIDLGDDHKSTKRARLSPTFDENIAPSLLDGGHVDGVAGRPQVMMTGLSVQMTNNLAKLVKLLGGVVTTKSSQVTHLVANKFVRTMKFFTVISKCRHVVTSAWLQESAKMGEFVGEEQYTLTDHQGERELGINLSNSLRRARTRPVFSDLTFYITPATPPGLGPLREVVENSGGCVVHRRPSARDIAARKTSSGVPTFIVVGCENDIHILRDLYDRKIPVYNAEFILTGALKQTIEFDQNLLTLSS